MLLTALLLRRDMCFVVPLDTVKELLPALRVPDVLNTDVHPLLHVAVADDLVDDDTDGVGSDVVNDTGPAFNEEKGVANRQSIVGKPMAQTYPW